MSELENYIKTMNLFLTNIGQVIGKAKNTYNNSNYDDSKCFVEADKTSKIPNGGVKKYWITN